MRLVEETAEHTAQSQNGGQHAFLNALENGDYDEMNVGDITKKLDKLSTDELRKVRNYEKQHKNRETLVEQIDRRIKAASAS